MWQRRDLVDEDCGIDPLLFLGQPILRSFAEVGGSDGKIALSAVARLERGPLGGFAGELAASLSDVALPDWIEQVGSAAIVRALADCSPGDGEALLLETNRVGDGAHTLAVFVADSLGGAASMLALTRVLDPLDDSLLTGRPLRFRPVDPALACRRALVAIDRTDNAPGMLLDENFVELRALAIARITHHPR